MQNFVTERQKVLDRFDRAILNFVQKNNLASHGEIGETVGLSGSAVRRRLALMRDNGVIKKDVSILDADHLGVTLFVTIFFATESLAIYDEFELQAKSLPEVRQCYHVAGAADYLLVVNVPSLPYYEAWSKEQFMSNEAIRRYDTIVAWACKKFETFIDVSEAI